MNGNYLILFYARISIEIALTNRSGLEKVLSEQFFIETAQIAKKYMNFRCF